MSLNCLRINTEEDMRESRLKEVQEENKKHNFKLWLDRSLSGNLSSNFRAKPNYPKRRTRSNLGPATKPRKAPSPLHLIHNGGADSAPVTPRLARSSGMRRDWSFEDLRRTLEG